LYSEQMSPNFDVWDDRPAVILIHGSFAADPAETWAQQRPLATGHKLLILHRRGYGDATPRVLPGFAGDVEDGIALLGNGAHLVGFSYGGVIALLIAAKWPQLVRSLTLIEPPAFGAAMDHPEVQALVQRLSVLYPSERYSPEQYRVTFLRALGGDPRETPVFTPKERQASIAAMNEAPPWEAPLDLATVATAPFPKLIVSGDWHPALDATADVLERVLGAERAVISGARHAVQQMGEPFNERLVSLWERAERGCGR
jgi:pimeloyl-ACP methyl ester carboxylesterase